MEDHQYGLKNLVDLALRRMNFDSSITKNQVETAYRKVVGEFINKLTRTVSYDVRSKTLKVNIASPALKSELTLRHTELLNAINGQLGTNAVQNILFV